MTPWLDDGDIRLFHGDALETVRGLPDGSVDCVVTSPPYWGLRDYGIDGQMGLEETPDEFVAGMVELFREIRRVLAPHGTCWVNLGDSYAQDTLRHRRDTSDTDWAKNYGHVDNRVGTAVGGLKPKDLCGIPWRVAFALQADGWWLRSDIIWAKPNPMPESVTDRPTKAHEYVFLLNKSPRYWFDTEAVREPHDDKQGHWTRSVNGAMSTGDAELHVRGDSRTFATPTRQYNPAGRNFRSVWQIATQPYPEAHFATYPEELARRCILAGCPIRVCRVCGKPSERIVSVDYDNPGNRTNNGKRDGDFEDGTVRVMSGGQRLEKRVTTEGWSDCGHNDWRPGVALDPFIGSGTTAKVARDHQRHAIGIDLNAEYLELAARRLQQLSLLT